MEAKSFSSADAERRKMALCGAGSADSDPLVTYIHHNDGMDHSSLFQIYLPAQAILDFSLEDLNVRGLPTVASIRSDPRLFSIGRV